jgi:hypothetical protein
MTTPFGFSDVSNASSQQPKPSLKNLTDTNTSTNLFHGQTLNYDSVNEKWKNGAQIPCWKDLIGETSFKGSGGTIPPFKQFRGPIFKTGFNATGNTIYYFAYHLPHDLILGTDLFIHAHHATISANETGTVEFQIQATYASVDDVFNDPIAIDPIIHTYAGLSDQYRHIVSEVQLSTSGGSSNLLDSDLLDTDGLIFIWLRRQDTDTIRTADDMFLFQVDVHYQASTGGTLNKTGPFRG